MYTWTCVSCRKLWPSFMCASMSFWSSEVWFVCMCVSLGACANMCVRVICVCLCLFQGLCMSILALWEEVCLMSVICYL